jgi:hypothetical protein
MDFSVCGGGVGGECAAGDELRLSVRTSEESFVNRLFGALALVYRESSGFGGCEILDLLYTFWVGGLVEKA